MCIWKFLTLLEDNLQYMWHPYQELGNIYHKFAANKSFDYVEKVCPFHDKNVHCRAWN